MSRLQELREACDRALNDGDALLPSTFDPPIVSKVLAVAKAAERVRDADQAGLEAVGNEAKLAATLPMMDALDELRRSLDALERDE